jgi:hypothetical protein
VAGKTGSLGALRNEVGVVHFEGEHPVAVAVFTHAARADAALPVPTPRSGLRGSRSPTCVPAGCETDEPILSFGTGPRLGIATTTTTTIVKTINAT